jgi:rhomboid family GlyGly-CTERM serine protease
MNSSAAISNSPETTRESRPLISLDYELGFFALVVVLLNLPLLHGGPSPVFVYLPGLVRDGEWWRVLTHPFVHVSWYHLLLDASAFFILYSGLQEKMSLKRLSYVAAAAVGSLLVSLWAAPIIYSIGLCGLSGVAHGLLAISALEMTLSKDKTIFRAGLISFALVIGKCAIEAATGEVVFAFFHGENIGTPIAICHAGGVLGGLFAWILWAVFPPLKYPFTQK